jgi:hypothetical protein
MKNNIKAFLFTLGLFSSFALIGVLAFNYPTQAIVSFVVLFVIAIFIAIYSAIKEGLDNN